MTALRDGRFLYVRFPFEVPSLPWLVPMVIVSYGLSGLSHRDKMRVTYRLFGRRAAKRYEGMVERAGGVRLGYGCVMVPAERAEDVTSLLRSFGVRYRSRTVYVPRTGARPSLP